MIEIRKTGIFAQWLDNLSDLRARARVQARIERLAAGNPGDVAPVGEGVSELRIHFGRGYRVDFKQRGRELVILLLAEISGLRPKISRQPCAWRVAFRSSCDEKEN